MKLTEIIDKETVDRVKMICEMFEAKYIFIDGVRYRVPNNEEK